MRGWITKRHEGARKDTKGTIHLHRDDTVISDIILKNGLL